MSILSAARKGAATIALIASVTLLSACGGSSGGSSPTAGTSPTSTTALHVSGSVGDGPVVSATVTATDSQGADVATVHSSGAAGYALDLPAGTVFPVTLTVSGGTDVVTSAAPSFAMTSAVFPNSGQVTININPFTTLIAKTAAAMSGGLNKNNVASAQALVLSTLGFGLDTRLVPDPFTSTVTATNAADLIKASEALAEMIRRVQSTLQVAGISDTPDQVISALAGDLSDGALDGAGPGADARITAAAKVASASVLVESMSNTLQVDGTDGTSQLDNAIQLVMPSTTQSTSDVVTTAPMISQAKEAVAAVQAFAPDPALSSLASALDQVPTDSPPSTVAGLLPSGADTYLQNAATLVATASDAELSAINSGTPAAGGGGPSGGTGGALTISNTSPASYIWDTLQVGKTVYVDRSYTFTGVPAQYAGLQYLQTANGDKLLTGTSVVSFTVSADATVYVAHDVRISPLPTWLSGWTATGTQLVTDDTTLDVYSKDFAAGTVALGGNGGTGNGSMYVVMVAPQQSGAQPPPAAPVVSLSAASNSVNYNGSTSLTWSSTDATSCNASGAWSGTKGTAGMETVGPLSTNSVFTLTCTGAGGQSQQSVTVSVAAPPATTPTVALSASPATVAYGGSATLNWSSGNTDSCTASGGWSGTMATSGSQSTGALTADTTFTLTCSGAGGTASQSFTVGVSAPPVPTVSLTANPNSVAYAGSTMLTWSSTNADSCTASGGWSGSKAVSGTETSGALSTSTTFSLSCTGAGGSASASASVSVQPATGSVTLSWTPPTTNADGSTLNDLAGYKIYYGTSSGNYSNTITVDNPGIATYVVDNLPLGTYFFAITAFDTSGNESTFSNEASMTVN